MKDPTNPFQDRGELQRELGKYCPACQAIPIAGYCRLAGCPNAPADGALPRQDDAQQNNGMTPKDSRP